MIVLALITLTAAFCSGLTVQSSKIDLTPPEPLPLGGYTERKGALFAPGGDPLWCRTEVLSEGKSRVALVSLEMLTVPESLVREVSARLPKDVRVFLSATHTHCAPDSQMLNDRMTFAIPGIASYKRRWLTWYADQIAKGIQGALKSLPTSVLTIELESSILAMNRGRRTGAKPSPREWTVLANHVPLITSYAAHATLFDKDRLQLSGDWPGAIMKQRGGIFLPGAIGDVSPLPVGKTPLEQIQSFVDVFRKLPHHGDTIDTAPLRWNQSSIPIDKPKPHPTFAQTNKIPEPLAQGLVEKFAPSNPVITSVRLGNLAIVGVPGEPTADLGRRIEDAGRELGFTGTIVVSHVNGWMGYILTPDDYDRGGYEATLSFNGRRTGDRVVAAAIESMRALR